METNNEMKETLYKLTKELIGRCKYCTLVVSNLESKAPIYCSRFNGPSHPTPLDVKTCLSCGEYKDLSHLVQVDIKFKNIN